MMVSLTIELITISACTAGGLWICLRTIAIVDLEILPFRCRRRLLWCQSHHRQAYLVCAAVFLTAAVANLSPIFF